MRWRRAKPVLPEITSAPGPLVVLSVTYGLCPTADCDVLVESWEVVTHVREVRETAPAWPGGPRLEVPGMIAHREPVGYTATWHPCGHQNSWEVGHHGYTFHTIDVPLDTPLAEVRRRLLDAREADAANGPFSRLRSRP